MDFERTEHKCITHKQLHVPKLVPMESLLKERNISHQHKQIRQTTSKHM